MTDWSQIVQEHGSLVWRTVYRLLTHDADAADCFQNTFVAAWQFAQRKSVRHWPGLLRRLATARALERLRNRYQQGTTLTQQLEPSVPDPGAIEPDANLRHDELAGELRRALATLDPTQAEVFCLACLEEMSYRDIAGQLGISVNHVGVLLNRARTRLRECLAAFHPDRLSSEKLDHER
jgi:RNA polymerase sigma-70 factor (ECF subfamily)